MNPKTVIAKYSEQINSLDTDEAVSNLLGYFLAMATWQTPDFAKTMIEYQRGFEEFVKQGELFGIVEMLKDTCLRKNVPLSDAVLDEFSANRVKPDCSLPPADRTRLSSLIDELLRVERRIRTSSNKPGPKLGATRARHKRRVEELRAADPPTTWSAIVEIMNDEFKRPSDPWTIGKVRNLIDPRHS